MRLHTVIRPAFGIALAATLAAFQPAAAKDDDWPREVKHPKGTILIYQPQIDDYVGTTLKARGALSVTLEGQKEPTFGAIWAEAKAHVDRDERVVTFSDIKVTRVRFPGATPEQEKALAAIIEEAAPKWDMSLDYDRFVAALAALRKFQETNEALRNDPPQIFVETEPAMLLLYDGTPQARDIENTKLRRIINTPSIVIEDPAAKSWYLYGGAGWFVAKEAMGPWKPGKPSQSVASLVAEMEKRAAESAKKNGESMPKDDEKALAAEAKKDNPKYDPSKPPKIIPVTGPAELVVFTGDPTWKPLVEGDVLYADNTGADILLDVATQQNFLLLSGRWYSTRNLKGPWTYVLSDKLPANFAKIPEDSPKGEVLSHIAGTPQAEEALADAQVPQVAAVKKGKGKLEVKYDGAPQWEKISGTSIEYAKNSPNKVLKIEGKYYACEQAVWYVSASANGPWDVAEMIPAEIQKIPPDSPAYNLKYVYVYDSTPEVVYVGYTPAYLGCYPYYGTVVWGTGYPYTPWVGSIYYPSPWSFGFHAHYNPYSGWSFGFSIGYSWGWGSISFGWGGYGWGGYPPPYWGPGGFYPVYRPPYYPAGGYPPYNPNRPGQSPGGGGTRPGAPSTLPAGAGGTRPSTQPAQPGGGGTRPSTQPAPGGGAAGASTLPAGGGSRAGNLYERPANRDQVASTKQRPSTGTLPTRPSTGAGGNNVFVNEAGDVFRRNSNGSWDQRTGNGWSPAGGSGPGTGAGSGAAGGGARPGTQPSTPGGGAGPSTPTTRPSGGSPSAMPSAPSSSLQRDYSSRDRGSTRSSSFQSMGGYGGGMPRGGGGGRRR
jgi:hypothetical protein